VPSYSGKEGNMKVGFVHAVAVSLVLLLTLSGHAQKEQGLTVASMGHSLVPGALEAFVKISAAAGYDGHEQIRQLRGGRRGTAAAHWGYTGERQVIKPALEKGEADVLTMAVHYQGSAPDDFGRWIELGLKHNPEMRFFIMDGWPQLRPKKPEGENAAPIGLEIPDMDTFAAQQSDIDAKVAGVIETLRAEYGNDVYLLPVGAGMLELRRRLEKGELPGVKQLVGEKWTSLYSDSIHPGYATRVMQGYVYFACIYQRDPTGLKNPFYNIPDRLNHILQEVAWDVVRENEYTGVK
jgi:hypothetical protein